MRDLTARLLKATAAAALVGLMAGCATTKSDDVRPIAEQAQSEASEAMATALEAKQAAERAQQTANEALRTAQEAKAMSEATDAKIDRMFKKAMQK